MNPRGPSPPRIPLNPKAFHILLALTERPLNGYQVMVKAEENTQGRVVISPGTLYEALHRFERQGLVEEAGPGPSRPSDRRGQRFFRLAAAGRRVLRAEAERLANDVELARAAGALEAS